MSNSSGSNIGSIFLVSFCCFLSIIFVVIGVVYSNQTSPTGTTATKTTATKTTATKTTTTVVPTTTTVTTTALKSCTADSKWAPTTVASGSKTSQVCPGGTTVYAECYDGSWKTIGACPPLKKIGETCVSDRECDGYKYNSDTLACDNGICVKQIKDWANIDYWKPSECKNALLAAPGTCTLANTTATTSPVYNLLKQKGTGLCLDGNASSLTLNNCSSTNDYQTWNNENGLLKQKGTGMCLDGNAAGMRLASCQVGNDYQTWTNENGLLKQKGTGMCLDGNAAGMRLASCQVGNDYQTWAATITATTSTTTTSKVLSCPSGYSEDLNGTCYTCGSGYIRSWDPVTAPTACVTGDIFNPQPKPATIVPKV